MNHGGVDPASVENRGPGAGSWSSSSGQASASWSFYGTAEAASAQPPSYYYDPQQPSAAAAAASHAPADVNAAAAQPPYSGYYYNGYQQQHSSDPVAYQQVNGANQNTGAPYQPLTSFPNAGPPSYSTTYYNPGDHQTAATAATGYGNSNQGSVWNNAGYGSYPSQSYPGYASAETNPAAAPVSYQQQYDPWAHYYSTVAPGVSGGAGAVASAPVAQPYPVQGASGGYHYPSHQPPPPGTTAWRDPGSSGLPSLQVPKDTATHNQNGGWEVGAQGFQNPQVHQLPSYFQKPLDSNPPLQNYENQQQTTYSQGLSSQLSSTNQVSENLQPPVQTVMALDTRPVNIMQIPTNPRIASSSVLGTPKTEKESSATSGAIKPAYISVSVPKLNEVPSHVDAEAVAKPGTLPLSLRAYVERTFARCKDDVQRASNQKIMMEMIKKASADGTLFTRNWDSEPPFPLPNTTSDMAESNLQSSVPASTLPKTKRSPSRRIKSRWEPITEDKLAERLESAKIESAKGVSWDNLKGADKGVDNRKYESKVNGWNGVKFVPSQLQTSMTKIGQRPMKKPRFSLVSNTTENDDNSSGSDKEQNLTKYYASAISLANTPEEKKRREHRSKRFEKGQESQTAIKHPRPRAQSGNIYTRIGYSLMSTKNNEDGVSKAVEDIDWDALKVRGTCQEIEKRYLRLTAAPDPASVRPEDILEKALHMVHSSQKNYLYKCDQLKSIRQDLTVQHIQNELTAKVYETHARLALEAGDMSEYNQCQSQLTRLYADGIKGSDKEFSAYNLLCVILHSDNKRDLLSSMARLSVEAKEDEAVKHALAVRSAVSSGNYILFFKLYESAPNLSTCLMDLYVEKMRFEAIKCISKSYRPTAPVTYIARVLGFLRVLPTGDGQVESKDGMEECKEWLQSHGAILTVESNGELQLDAKASASSLYMPEPEDAVAHGDATLGVDDFLTRAS